jgi:peptide/nickel transport system permease protein
MTTAVTSSIGPTIPEPSPRPRRRTRYGIRVALVFLILVVVAALLASVLAPYGYNEQDYDAVLSGASSSHWLGTDHVGRDVLSRLLYGARISLGSAAVAVAVAAGIGIPLGLLSGYFARWFDEITVRLMDTLIAFPGILLAIAITAALGTGTYTAMIAVGVVLSPAFVRLTRAQVFVVRNRLYVDAARTFGLSNRWIITRHVIPNAIQPVIVLTAHMLGAALLIEAGLSFLGLGTPPPHPSWGGMLQDASRYLDGVAVQLIAPGLAIALTLLAFNIVGDAMRDLLDPRAAASTRLWPGRSRVQPDDDNRDRHADPTPRLPGGETAIASTGEEPR